MRHHYLAKFYLVMSFLFCCLERSTFENGIERTSSPVSFLNRSFSLDSLDDSLDVVDNSKMLGCLLFYIDVSYYD